MENQNSLLNATCDRCGRKYLNNEEMYNSPHGCPKKCRPKKKTATEKPFNYEETFVKISKYYVDKCGFSVDRANAIAKKIADRERDARK